MRNSRSLSSSTLSRRALLAAASGGPHLEDFVSVKYWNESTVVLVKLYEAKTNWKPDSVVVVRVLTGLRVVVEYPRNPEEWVGKDICYPCP